MSEVSVFSLVVADLRFLIYMKVFWRQSDFSSNYFINLES